MWGIFCSTCKKHHMQNWTIITLFLTLALWLLLHHYDKHLTVHNQDFYSKINILVQTKHVRVLIVFRFLIFLAVHDICYLLLFCKCCVHVAREADVCVYFYSNVFPNSWWQGAHIKCIMLDIRDATTKAFSFSFYIQQVRVLNGAKNGRESS